MPNPPITSARPLNWTPIYLMHVLYVPTPNVKGSYTAQIVRLARGENVREYLRDLLAADGRLGMDRYPDDDFDRPRTCPIVLRPQDFAVRGSTYVVIELDNSNEAFFFRPGKAITTANNAISRNADLNFVETTDQSVVRFPNEAPVNCRFAYFAVTGRAGCDPHRMEFWVSRPGLISIFGNGDDTIDPDVPNDGGQHYPPGLMNE